MASSAFDSVTLRYWHGGGFKMSNTGELVYVGGEGRTFKLDPDELCFFDLLVLAKKCGQYEKVHGLFYLIPGLSLVSGLRKINNDIEVFELGKLVLKFRTIDIYVSHCEEDAKEVEGRPYNQSQPVSIQPRKKLPPKRKVVLSPTRSSPRNKKQTDGAPHSHVTPSTLQPTQKDAATSAKTDAKTHSSIPEPDPSTSKANPNLSPQKQAANPSHSEHINFEEGYDWEDDRPDSPIPWNELISDPSSEGGTDPEYEPQEDEGYDTEGDKWMDEEGFLISEELEQDEDGDESINVSVGSEDEDEEVITARQRVRSCKSRLHELATDLQQKAVAGTLHVQQIISKEGEQGESGYQSEYIDSEDEIHTPPASGDEGEGSSRSKQGMLLSVDTDWSNFVWKVGYRFPTRRDFREAVARYAVDQGRDLAIVRSNKKRCQHIAVKCVKGCPFYLFASWHSRMGTFIVKSVKPVHTCHRNMKKNRQLTSTWVARQFLEVFKAKPHWPAKDIVESIRKNFKMLVKASFAYKVKYHAHRMLHGSMKDHYLKVGSYMEALLAVSPGTVVELKVDMDKRTDPPTFQRFYTCFEGLQQGWKEGCRNVLCVDSSFLKTFLGGQIISAVGRDGNDQMFPVAWAIVEGENNQSYDWFFNRLKSCLDLGDGKGICIISDEHQAIISSVASILPNAEHRHCARHIFANWHKKYKGDEFKLLFWKIAKAYNMADFTEALAELREVNAEAATAFEAYKPMCFCRAYLDASVKCDAITSNMAETFNGYIINARTKHLLYMVEDIRVQLMQRLVAKRQEVEKGTWVICPRIQLRLEKEKAKASECEVLPSTDNLFNVKYYLDQLTVDLNAKSCTCRKWDMTGIPCCHAIACIFFKTKEAEAFVDHWYSREMYTKAYGVSIPPIEGERYWPPAICKILPPPIKIGPGRPRKNRVKAPEELKHKPGKLSRKGTEMTCSMCSVKGHNKRKCPTKNSSAATQQPPSKMQKSQPTTAANASTSTPIANPTAHHNQSAQPTQLGKNGRAILRGVGAKATRGGRGDGRGAGRGGRASRGEGRGGGLRGGRGSRGGRGGLKPVGGCGPVQIGTQSSHA